MKNKNTLAISLLGILSLGGLGPATFGAALAAPVTTTAATADVVSGAWSGRFDDMIDFTAQLKLQGANVAGTITYLKETYQVGGRWDAAAQRLKLTYKHRNGLVTIAGVVKNGALIGAYDLKGPGALTMKRAGSAASTTAGATATNDFTKATPYVLKGTVKNPAGQPVAGVEVWADNTLYYNMNALGKTDASGHFVIQLPQGQLGTWQAGGRLRTVYQGESIELDLQIDKDDAFTADKGAVRNFTLLTSGPRGNRYWGGTIWPNDGSGYVYERVEYTLTPVGPLVDGTAGQILKRFAKGNIIPDVPLGKYKVTARYLPTDGPERDMQLKSRDADEWDSSVVITFRREPQYGLMADFDIRLPK
ncbi:carboxypeptidase-like regulatory domain-containing protein [Deinococcus yavapaiensis]|uniref:Carboxypeptidase family protein n=1 Tax=Deinococcus yavapaiensis KR-236 TaxID=694435 RepID=A0A318SEA1_9DEIO|nr:carboxypeptidase-like regulatory domain-containing protein [Deinococcus yavapaiensis]PYE55421.1 hypothetical protein DES52_103254 [Deinococcus yavapaiensis KR-236]